jgi:hypothetical protein
MPIIATALLSPAVLAVAIPQAPVVTYGIVRDEYGSPLGSAEGAELLLVKDSAPNGTVYARTVVGESAYPGQNYRLSLEIDSEGPSRSYAVVSGTQMRITCQIDGEAQSLTPSPTFATPENGTAQRLDFSLGDDADGDGLPDVWEAWVLLGDGRACDAAAIAAFKPGDDADGDGMANGQEYLAGTDPFLATDLLMITSYRKLPGTSRVEIKFTTTYDRIYRIVKTDSLSSPVWSPVATTRKEDGEPAYETYSGTGRIITVYLDVDDASSAFFRVAAN